MGRECQHLTIFLTFCWGWHHCCEAFYHVLFSTQPALSHAWVKGTSCSPWGDCGQCSSLLPAFSFPCCLCPGCWRSWGSCSIAFECFFAPPALSEAGNARLLDGVEAGVPGESLLYGVRRRPPSVCKDAEFFCRVCVSGSVGSGVKFYTLGIGLSSFACHSKKVCIEQGHLYVSARRNSAFTHHHSPAESLSESELNCFLQEYHAEKEQLSNSVTKDMGGHGSTFNFYWRGGVIT